MRGIRSQTKVKIPYTVQGQVWQIPTGDIRPNPHQPRKAFALDKLVELAQSISENGILQPLTVTFTPDGPVLVAGERRLRAARIAGLSTVPCVEAAGEERRRRVLTLVENMQRQDMNCFEEAEGIRALIDTYELTQNEAAQQLGYSQAAVANKLRLLRLSEDLRARLVAAGLGERHARALLRLPDRVTREQAAARIIGEHLTAAQADRLVDDLLAGRVHRRPPKPLIKDLRVFFNTMNHAVEVMRRGGIGVESHRREEDTFIEYVVKIEKK